MASTLSASDRYRLKKEAAQQIPIATHTMYKQVSDYRKNTLADEVKRGLFRDGATNTGKIVDNGGLSDLSNVVASFGMKKQAEGFAGSSFGGASYKGGMGDTLRQSPEVYSPLWLNSNLNLPRDRATINAWLRSFFALVPYVQNAINLHSTYPISKLSLKCANKKVEQFFNTMIEDIDLLNICVQVAQEFWLLGEAFVFAELDERKGVWSRLMIQNPDYIVVKPSIQANEPLILLRADENLRRIVFSNRPADLEQKGQINQTIIEHVKRGENIPLDNFYISHLARKIAPYENRGTGLPVSCFRELMLFQLLRESKFVQAQSMINPMTVVKIGGQADYRPQVGDLEAWREIFAQAEYDRDFKIFTHDGVNIERIGWNQGIYDISGDITQLLKEIYMGLMVPNVVMEGSGDISYQNGAISLDILRQRYMQFREMLSKWLTKKIFAPISQIQEFYEYKDGEKKLITPQIDWNHLSLFDTNDYVQVLVQLSTQENKQVSQHTLYRSLGLDFEDEKAKMKQEDIQNAIRKKELMSLDRLSLTELKALGEGDDIPEIIDDASNVANSPYSNAQQGPPGADMGMGLGGGGGGSLGLGALPGLSPPSSGAGPGAPTSGMPGGAGLGGGSSAGGSSTPSSAPPI